MLSAAGHDEGDVMDQILTLMDRSRARLSETNDGGVETQAIQKDIVSELMNQHESISFRFV